MTKNLINSIDNYLKLKTKIEDYLDGNLNEAEKTAFELAIQQDAELAKRVAIVKEINQTISTEKQFQEYKKKLADLNEIYFSSAEEESKNTATIKVLPKRNNRWLVAASILVLAISSVLIWNILKIETVDSAALYASNFEPYNVGQRGSNDDGNKLEQEITETYNAANYLQAINLLNDFLVNNPDDDEAILQLGSAYSSTNQSKLAINTFKKIPDSSINYQAAQWYLSLAYLQDNQIEQAKSSLKALSKLGERVYPTKAKALLENL